MKQRTTHDHVLDDGEALARQIAGETLADVRTVRRVLRGEAVRGLVGQRIRTAIERRSKRAPAAGSERISAA